MGSLENLHNAWFMSSGGGQTKFVDCRREPEGDEKIKKRRHELAKQVVFFEPLDAKLAISDFKLGLNTKFQELSNKTACFNLTLFTEPRFSRYVADS